MFDQKGCSAVATSDPVIVRKALLGSERSYHPLQRSSFKPWLLDCPNLYYYIDGYDYYEYTEEREDREDGLHLGPSMHKNVLDQDGSIRYISKVFF